MREHWSHVDTSANKELQDVVRIASILLESSEPELAELVITTFSHRALAEALSDCRVLADAAYIRMKAAGS